MKYAEWTRKACADSGISFDLRRCPRTELEEQIMNANQDSSVHGIMVYYPVFGDPQVRYCCSALSTLWFIILVCLIHIRLQDMNLVIFYVYVLIYI
jgi:hypothetical protein